MAVVMFHCTAHIFVSQNSDDWKWQKPISNELSQRDDLVEEHVRFHRPEEVNNSKTTLPLQCLEYNLFNGE
jgi:hypothetical protein